MANRKWPRHKDPLNLRDKYDLTDYISSIPIVEETSSKISNNKAILKEKEKLVYKDRKTQGMLPTHICSKVL